MAKERTAEQQEMMDKMDASAKEAGVELDEIFKVDADQLGEDEALPDVSAVADWWKKWYPKAGHKRLGKLLVKYGK